MNIATIKEILSALPYEPSRIVCPKALYEAVSEAVTCEVVHTGDVPIQTYVHPLIPEDMIMVFGVSGNVEVIRLEKKS